MKNIYFIILTLLLSGTLFAQKYPPTVRLKNGELSKDKNLLGKKITGDQFRNFRYQNKYYVLIQFDRFPHASEKNQLQMRGVRLFDYLPPNGFLAEITDSSLIGNLQQFHATAVFDIPHSLKISRRLIDQPEESPANSLIAVSFFGTVDKADVMLELVKSGAQVIPTKIQPAHTIFVKANAETIQKIAALPFVTNVSSQILKDIPLNYNDRSAHSLDALNTESGRDLHGKNVTVGIGDNADPSSHIDFNGRLILRTPGPADDHGTHTTGTIGGGGIIDPRYRGMAPKATLINQLFSDILVNAPVYVNDFNMVVTNNSYFSGAPSCAGEGEYNVLSTYVDAQLNEQPFLIHDFAAGNDGGTACNGYPTSFATIKSGFQVGKNVLTVGAIDNSTYTIADFSSRGPVNDGRIKPEIVAGGVDVISTIRYNNYYSFQGTSMASPVVTGTMALLVERYRQLHAGANPPGALLKTIACNTADDIGNPGPDFTFGFGTLNARAAVEAIENNHYFLGTANDAAFTTHTITNVPAGARVKIMLYWSDPEASPYAVSTLVNNLDLSVTAFNGNVHLPLILNPNPASVTNNAVEGVDNINNIEQVVFTNLTTGDVSVKINGTAIPTSTQDYVVAYEVVNPSVTLEYPYGAETWVPGEIENIRWNSFGLGANTVSIDYSADNGVTWSNISPSVPANARTFPFTIPAVPTNLGLIKVICGALGFSDVSHYDFTVLGQPVITAAKPCQGSVQLNWSAITGATLYEIMMLKGDSMQAVANTISTNYLLQGLSKDSSYWLTVRAVNSVKAGRRAIALQVFPNSGACSLAAFNNDFTIDSLVAPITGRMFTSSQLGNISIQAKIRNLGSIVSGTSFAISYQVNGGTIVTESNSHSILSKGTYTYTFSPANSFDFSSPGTYTVKVWIKNTGDGQVYNDTLTTVIKQLVNDPVVLASVFTEGFETATPQSYTSKTAGLEGLDRADYSNSGPYPRLRTFVNTGFARTGDRCITLDQVRDTTVTSADSLITTFNLSGYTTSDQIWLDFYYKNQGTDFSVPGNQVWIRGNDHAAWIPVYTLSTNINDIGIYKPSVSVNITEVLAAASQAISSSFQVKFGQQGYTSANSVIPDSDLDDGYSFDDITITRATNDVGLNALMQPALTNICGLSNAETISVQLKNYSASTLGAMTVTYAVNGDTVTENVASLAPGLTTYSFIQKADLSAFQHYVLSTWVTYSGDNYHKNDTLPAKDFYTSPTIGSFPYLEGFETSNGNWYTQGINDSWQWGTPAKSVISQAANGTKAWVTNLTGNYNDNELSYLYSPCFNLSSMTSPVLSFSHIFQMEDNCDCDYHWAEYSTDDVTWIKLGAVGSGTNWYDYATKQAWKLSNTKWHVSSYYVPTNAAKVRFRIVMNSDQGTNYEGIGIDDINIFDKAPIYSGANITSGLNQTVSGNNWIDFTMGGKRVASINPNGQNLGNTNVKVYINTGPVRNSSNQYYLDRNIVIQPTVPPTGNVSVRFYFLDTEVQKLINASGCAACTGINDPYAAGVTQYSNAPLEEDGSLGNNLTGTYKFLTPHGDVNVIPYDSGYYASYQVNGFSEFWINGGGPGQNLPLPLVLQNFTATLVNKTGLLQWTTSQEVNSNEFIIEKSTDGVTFSEIGVMKAQGNSSIATDYQFTDNNLVNGINYYRLKMTDLDGNFKYSPVDTIDYADNDFTISVFPNPVTKGILYITTKVNCNRIEVYDVAGRFIKAKNVFGLQNNISTGSLSKGVYLINILTDTGKKIEKVFVE